MNKQQPRIMSIEDRVKMYLMSTQQKLFDADVAVHGHAKNFGMSYGLKDRHIYVDFVDDTRRNYPVDVSVYI